jgi:hypothetical protein
MRHFANQCRNITLNSLKRNRAVCGLVNLPMARFRSTMTEAEQAQHNIDTKQEVTSESIPSLDKVTFDAAIQSGFKPEE